jgi:hypothetical protein
VSPDGASLAEELAPGAVDLTGESPGDDVRTAVDDDQLDVLDQAGHARLRRNRKVRVISRQTSTRARPWVATSTANTAPA